MTYSDDFVQRLDGVAHKLLSLMGESNDMMLKAVALSAGGQLRAFLQTLDRDPQARDKVRSFLADVVRQVFPEGLDELHLEDRDAEATAS